jgi:predicted small secreted protein
MKIHILFAIIILLSISANAQISKNDSVKSVRREFKNQGEQEDYWAVELFKRDYKRQQYEIYKGSIIMYGNTYRYNDIVLTVYTNPELKAIFKKGIFYPGIMGESFKDRTKIRLMKDTMMEQQKKDTSKKMKKFDNNLVGTDSLTIHNFEELRFLSSTPKQKRFRFWLEGKYPIANPTVCFLELTNENATATTDIITFINGAKLTFFEEGWVIL